VKIGEKVCTECGFVSKEQLISHKPEWRAFNMQEKASRSRVGMPRSMSMGDYGLHTMIDTDSRSIKGKVSRERQLQIKRLSKWQRRVTNSKKIRNLNQAMGILSNLCSHLHIPNRVKEQTALYYRKALKANLVRGRSIEAIMAACLFAACRITQTQRRLKDIAEYSSLDTKEIARNYRVLYNKLKLNMPRVKAHSHITKIANKIGVKPKVQRVAISILRAAEKQKITAGKSPSGLAAAAMYIACKQGDDKSTQKDIAYAAGVTEVTVRNRYRELVSELGLDLN